MELSVLSAAMSEPAMIVAVSAVVVLVAAALVYFRRKH